MRNAVQHQGREEKRDERKVLLGDVVVFLSFDLIFETVTRQGINEEREG